jgi:hypothetical protein
VRSLWGSSSTEDLGRRLKYLPQQRSMAVAEWASTSMRWMNRGGQKVAVGEVQVGSGWGYQCILYQRADGRWPVREGERPVVVMNHCRVESL